MEILKCMKNEKVIIDSCFTANITFNAANVEIFKHDNTISLQQTTSYRQCMHACTLVQCKTDNAIVFEDLLNVHPGNKKEKSS